MPNLFTLIAAIRDALATDVALTAWCNTNYGQPQSIFVGVDQRKPPNEDDYPCIHLFPLSKASGYDLTEEANGVGLTCGVVNEAETSGLNDKITQLESIPDLETYRGMIIGIVGANVSGGFIDRVTTTYNTIEFFPFALATMQIQITNPYAMGDDPIS